MRGSSLNLPKRLSLYGVSVASAEFCAVKVVADALFLHGTWADEPTKQARQRSVRRAVRVLREHMAEGSHLTPPNFAEMRQGGNQ